MFTDFALAADAGTGTGKITRVFWTGGYATGVCGVRATGFGGTSESPKKSTLLLAWCPLAMTVAVAVKAVVAAAVGAAVAEAVGVAVAVAVDVGGDCPTNSVGEAAKELEDNDALLLKLGAGLREVLGLLAKLTKPISLSVEDCIVNTSLGSPPALRLTSVSCEDLLLVILGLVSRSASFQSTKEAVAAGTALLGWNDCFWGFGGRGGGFDFATGAGSGSALSKTF